MKNVLVTGGAGYIGSHACLALKNAGYCPVTLDNFSSGWRDAVKFGPVVECDLLDHAALHDVFKDFSPIAVMHFAASSEVTESVSNPGKYWRNNVLGSLNLIEASVVNNCNNFIFSSTCATYGDQDNVLLNEDMRQDPNNPYGASKRSVEEIINHYGKAYNLRYVIFRYFNVAGAEPEGQIGELHDPETHLIPLILDAISGQRENITIFGTDYETPDGTCIRDYVHVCDLVDAHLLGLKWLEQGKPNRVYNLGTGRGFSVREVINHVSSITNQELKVLEGPRRKGDCTALVASSNLAYRELGWEPRQSTLDKMISDAWRWHQNHNYKK